MRSNTIITFLIATVSVDFLSQVAATGINCNGNSECGVQGFKGLYEIKEIIDSIPDGTWFNNGQHIACSEESGDKFCAFLQNSGGAPSSSVKALVQYLVDHGCKGCGSVPLFYPGDNNVANGELTINYTE